MPVKKSTAAPKAAKSVEVKDHKHAALEAEIAKLKKEIEALKGQCHSCCADLESLKSQPQQATDPRVDQIISALLNSHTVPAIRKKMKSLK
tara:strand:+ start:110 stop:382 length:273 start_codon:yes stop_codon:yes gene_type:complete